MKRSLACSASGLLLLASLATAPAQSVWSYFISDAGGGNSLLTWTVSGSLATPPGAFLVTHQSSIAVFIDAPGIYADSYVAAGTPQSLPSPDGSYFQLDGLSVYTPIVVYNAANASGTGNDRFGLASATFPPHEGDPGNSFLYNPGTRSTLIPIDCSNFNPGTYQSVESGFDTPLTVNLTVGSVPEPSMLALSAVVGLYGLLARRCRKNLSTPYREQLALFRTGRDG